MKRILLAPLLLLILLLFKCDKSPTAPDLDEEAKNIPWQKITGKLAYSRTEIGDEMISYLFFIDGNSKKLNFVQKAKGMMFANLCWKYDGSTLTFSTFNYEKNLWQLFNIKPEGGNISNVYPADAHCKYPAWSTDGRLAYWYNGLLNIHEIRIDGYTFFNKAFCNQTRPAWSPDGKTLIISMFDKNSQGSLYKISLIDTSITPLLLAEGEWNEEIFHDPIYSPDGSRIAFMKFGNSIAEELWMMNSDGSAPEKLADGSCPAWSPDGQYIAFSHMVTGKTKLFIISLDDRSITQVTEKEASNPTWIP